MSLSAKVKDILHSGESKDRSTADNTKRPPGSFTTEDMEPSETYEGYSKGYEHNKLHKADDPRGWTHGDNNAPRGHAHKDSGVGLTENDPTSYKPSQEPISERRNDPLNGTTESTAAGGLGDTTNLASKEGTSGTTVPSTSEHPHWGDIPSGGVHNSVVGHGSPEDENARHRAVHSGAAQPTRTSGTLESGTFRHRHDRDQSSSNNNPHDTQRLAQENPNLETSDSNFNKGVAGAGAGRTATLGAHELNMRRHADETPTKADQTTEKTHSEEHKGRSFPLLGKDRKDHHKETKEDKYAKEPKKEHESKLGALFHRRGSKDKTETEAKAEQEADKERHSHSKAAPALAAAGSGGAYAATMDQHDDKKRDSTTGTHQNPSAIRGATQYPAAGLGSTRDYSTQGSQPTTGAMQQPYQQGSHRGTGLATGAAAGLGAGALAPHDGQRSGNSRTDPQSSTGYDAQSYDPASRSATNPTPQSYQQQGSHGDHGLAKVTAAGLGAGALASHFGHQHSGSTQPSALDSTQGYSAQRDQPANFSHKDPAGQQHGSHRGAGLAADTAAGLSASALASRSGRDHQSDQHGLESNRGFEPQGTQPTQTSTRDLTSQYYQHEGSHRGAGLAAGTAAGLGTKALASHDSSKKHDEDRYLSNDSSQRAQPRATGTGSALGGTSASGFDSSRHEPFPGSHNQSHHSTHHSTLAENANAGKYNTLASGTPSGVKYDDDVDTSRSTQQAHVDTPQKKDNHYGTAAGLGAAAAGAGTAGALSRNRDEKPVDKEDLTHQTEPRTERQLDRDTESHKPITGAVAPRSGVNKPVIHKCQKCGEDNDISQYFTSNAAGKI
jgi:hypothetical protein